MRPIARKLAAVGLVLALFSAFESAAPAQFFGGNGLGRGPGFYNRGYGGFYGNGGYYARGFRGYGGRGYNRGYGYGNRLPGYSTFYGNMIPGGLGSPYVTPYVGNPYAGLRFGAYGPY